MGRKPVFCSNRFKGLSCESLCGDFAFSIVALPVPMAANQGTHVLPKYVALCVLGNLEPKQILNLTENICVHGPRLACFLRIFLWLLVWLISRFTWLVSGYFFGYLWLFLAKNIGNTGF